MKSILIQPAELLIKQILLVDSIDIKNLKLVNRQFYNFIKTHEEFIYKKKLEQEYGKWVCNPKLLFKCTEYGININDLCYSKQFDTIYFCIENGELEIIKFLINNNIIDVNIKDFYGKPLFVYFFDDLFNNSNLIIPDCIELFLEKNIKVEILQQAYYHACKKCDKLTIKKMIEKGIDIRLRDIYGWSGQMYAILYNDDITVIEYLSKHVGITLSDISEIVMYKQEKLLTSNNQYKMLFNSNEQIVSFYQKFEVILHFEYVYFIANCHDKNFRIKDLLEYMQVMGHLFKNTSNTNKIHIFMKICNTINYYYGHLTLPERNTIFDIFLKKALENASIQQHIDNSIYKDIFDSWIESFH